MPRWGMVIDIDRCIGCYSCTVACHVENGTPPGIWYAPVYEKEVGTFPKVKRLFLPTLCMHCAEPACMNACPTKAISRRADGIVLVDQNVCCGSRACVTACPYGAMHFYDDGHGDFNGGLTPYEQSFEGKYQVGTAQKCTFCVHRIDQGIFMPACVESCPTGCRIFGDLDDPDSPPNKLISNHSAFALRPEADTSPSIRYVTPALRSTQLRPTSQAAAAGPVPECQGAGALRARSGNDFTGRLQVEAKMQNTRGLSHAIWFLFTGLGGALYLNQLLFGIDTGQILGMPLANVLGIVLLSLSGLVLVEDLGKPFRFLGVLRNVGSSWISIGAIADFVFILLGGVLLLPYLTIGGQQPLDGLLWAPGVGPEPILTWLVGAAAFFIIIYPGLELSASRSIPFWHTILIPLQFLSFATASAVGIAYLIGSLAPSRLMATIALVAVLTGLAFSLAHIQNARFQQGAARISADKLMKGSLKGYYFWGSLVVGLIVPGMILLLDVAQTLPGSFLALAGVLLLGGNFLAKYALIKAGYYASLF